ncbi:MAG: SpoIID/LytB domain-containing protein [Acidobacteriaceae bacterium]
MKRALLCLLLVLLCAGKVRPQEREQGARALTVEIFSARRIASLSVTPAGKNETFRVCSSCRAKAVTAPFMAKLKSGEIALSSGEHAREVELEGAFRIKPDGADAVAAAGRWKLTVTRGELRVLLTIDSERYVALVLRGEAGANEPIESLKAMAVVARTYALEDPDRHGKDGFNLCDSTHCQALRFGQPSATAERAVLETTGETLWYGARRARVFYTQNCGGETEDASQAWRIPREPYLAAHADPWCTRHGASAWHAEIPAEQMRAVFRSEGWALPERVDGVRIVQRTNSGRAEKLEFAGAGERVPVAASSFRFALDRALGWNELRSDWYTISLSNGVVHFEGRGYGHGVGLCQAGAAEMAAEGHASGDILSFYFPGTQVGITSQDRGWSSTRGAGWTLWTATPSAQLLKEGNAAWGKAAALFSPRKPVQPEVWQLPTTELFRQTAHEPGWMLASAQGAKAFLQPAAVLERSGREEETLQHEFLHVLVESEASAQAPLWLREGLVEALAERVAGQSTGQGASDARNLDAALARPESEAESQRAHVQAARLARALVARYGLNQVRQWLRSGSVPDVAIRTVRDSP